MGQEIRQDHQRESNQPIRKMNCNRCNQREEEIGYECPICHGVTICMIVVQRIWLPHELAELASKLETKTLKDFTDESIETGAFLRRKLAWTIKRMSHVAKVDGDTLKMHLVDAIGELRAHLARVKEHDEEKGEGSYLRAWVAQVTKTLKKATP